MFLEILQNAQENNYARVSFLLKLQAHNFTEKETLARVFSYEFCEISKNMFSYRTPPMAASGIWNIFLYFNFQRRQQETKIERPYS